MISDQHLAGYIDSIFTQYDVDNSGGLDTKELTFFFNDMYKAMGINMQITVDQVQKTLATIDVNHDGRASKQQLFQAFKVVLANQGNLQVETNQGQSYHEAMGQWQQSSSNGQQLPFYGNQPPSNINSQNLYNPYSQPNYQANLYNQQNPYPPSNPQQKPLQILEQTISNSIQNTYTLSPEQQQQLMNQQLLKQQQMNEQLFQHQYQSEQVFQQQMNTQQKQMEIKQMEQHIQQQQKQLQFFYQQINIQNIGQFQKAQIRSHSQKLQNNLIQNRQFLEQVKYNNGQMGYNNFHPL